MKSFLRIICSYENVSIERKIKNLLATASVGESLCLTDVPYCKEDRLRLFETCLDLSELDAVVMKVKLNSLTGRGGCAGLTDNTERQRSAIWQAICLNTPRGYFARYT